MCILENMNASPSLGTFMTTQRLYLASHPPYLTSQPLYLCHHTNGTHICIDVALYRWWGTQAFKTCPGPRSVVAKSGLMLWHPSSPIPVLLCPTRQKLWEKRQWRCKSSWERMDGTWYWADVGGWESWGQGCFSRVLVWPTGSSAGNMQGGGDPG